MKPDDDLLITDSRPRFIRVVGIVVEIIGCIAIGLISGIFIFLCLASGG